LEAVIFYLEFLGILAIPCLLAIFLFKKKILKTVRSTYYVAPILLTLFFVTRSVFLYNTRPEMECGFPLPILIPLIFLISTALSIFVQYVLNKLFNLSTNKNNKA